MRIADNTWNKTRSEDQCCSHEIEQIPDTMHCGPINGDPKTMGGTPVFTGTSVPIQTLFDYIRGGDDLNEFIK